MSHTKGEWNLWEGRNKQYKNKIAGKDYEATIQKCYYISGPGDSSHFVADLIVTNNAEGKANARRICHCHNNFDKLLDACKTIQAARDNCRNGNMAVTPQLKKELDGKLDAAIAEAEPSSHNGRKGIWNGTETPEKQEGQ